MNSVKITPSYVNGIIEIPPSKSISHRVVIAAALSNRTSSISHIGTSEDIAATCAAVEKLGAELSRNGDILNVKGKGCIEPAESLIDCCESGSTLRFIIPVALMSGKKVAFTGKESLAERPLGPYFDIFEKHGISYSGRRLPFEAEGVLKAGEYRIRGDISSQFVTGLMFALPIAKGDSIVKMESKLQSSAYIDITIDVLRKFSIEIENNNYNEFYIKGGQRYVSTDYYVEGDYSQAAFYIVAGLLGNEVQCLGLNEDTKQGDSAIVEIAKQMGGRISCEKGVLKAEKSKTHGIVMDVSECPDLVPAVAVLASLSEGTTIIKNAARLRLKESDRLKAVSTELCKLGADIHETEDGLIINGKDRLEGGEADSWNDHRIAMALAAASIGCRKPVVINKSPAVNKSYPEFFNDFRKLGGIVDEQ